MDLSRVRLEQITRTEYVVLCKTLGRAPRRPKKRAICSKIRTSLSYADRQELLNDFLEAPFSDEIYVSNEFGQKSRKFVWQMGKEDVKEITEMLKGWKTNFNVFELKFLNKDLMDEDAPSYIKPRRLILSFSQTPKGLMVLSSVNLPGEYRGWMQVKTKKPYFRYNFGILNVIPDPNLNYSP